MSRLRTPIIAGNWKMHTTSDEAVTLVGDMLDDLDALEGVEVVLCPPFISLVAIHELLTDTAVQLGAQNCFWEPQGAFTGEIAPSMLAPLCRYVIVGHSERRQYFGETDAVVARKAQAVLAADLRPIVCVGETLAEHDAGLAQTVVSRQVESVFGGLTVAQARRCVIAYEPIWAIGTGRPAAGSDAQSIMSAIRAQVAGLLGPDVGAAIRLQYGGSVNGTNAAEFLAQPDIDGALVGGASLKPADFVRICAVAQQLKR